MDSVLHVLKIRVSDGPALAFCVLTLALSIGPRIAEKVRLPRQGRVMARKGGARGTRDISGLDLPGGGACPDVARGGGAAPACRVAPTGRVSARREQRGVSTGQPP